MAPALQILLKKATKGEITTEVEELNFLNSRY